MPADKERLGLLNDDRIIDPLAAFGRETPDRAVFRDMVAFIRSGETGIRLAGEIIAAAPINGREPEFFVKTADCVVGPDAPIIHDKRLTEKLDCETELAVVIGKPGRHIAVATALDHVFSYTIVTAGEIADPQALQLSMRINGELRQSATTGDMIWSCAIRS